MKKRALFLAVALSLIIISFSIADAAPLPSNRHIYINVANDAGAKYNYDWAYYGNGPVDFPYIEGASGKYLIKADGGGLNANHITTDLNIYSEAKIVNNSSGSQTGTFYLADRGGRGFSDDVILMLSVSGPIDDNFSVNIKASGYTWTPNPVANIAPTDYAYKTNALNETFTKADVMMYGPQSYRPGPGAPDTLPFYHGEDAATTSQYFMFIDLNLGALYPGQGNPKLPADLINLGDVKVEYSFTNLYSDAAFNMYGWCLNSNQGEGINWTNDTNGNTTTQQGGSTTASSYLIKYEGSALTLTKSGAGAGSVTASPGTLNWSGKTGKASYANGTQVTLTAAPGTGSTFTGWSGACTGTGNCTVTMDSAKSVTAAFTLNTVNTFTITATAGSGGSISPATIVVTSGASQTFTITPSANYHVEDVSVDGVSVGAVTTYNFSDVTAAHTISATFAIDTVIDTFTIATTAGSGGSISPASPVVTSGASQTFTITPSANYHVEDVSVDGASVGAVTTYNFSNVTAAHTISATFAIDTAIDTYALTLTKSGDGSGSVTALPGDLIWSGTTGNASYAYGTQITLTAAPDTGSAFTGWSGACTGTDSCTITMDANKTLMASFTNAVVPANAPTVTVKASGSKAKEEGAVAGEYRITRTGDTTNALTVYFTMSGTAATDGSDYTMPSYLSATVPAGQKYVDVILTPIDDAVYDLKETAVLNLSSSSAYKVGSAASATVAITDNESVVTVKASPAKAKEEGAVAGKYRITRKGGTSTDLTVYFTMSGTATAGSHYAMSSYTSATIPAGMKYVDVVLTPIDDAIYNPNETAVFTLSSDNAYSIGSSASATITITDNESIVTVKASPAKAKEKGAVAGKYRITRKGGTSTDLTVNFTMSGTATARSHYTMSSYTSATIPAGAKYVDVVLTSIDDAIYNPNETAILTISPDSAYGIGSSSSATITIIDNDPQAVTFAMKMTGISATSDLQTAQSLQGYDFNGDGNADILLQDASGAIQLWYMQNDTRKSQVDLEPPMGDACWKLAGVADFNADNKMDILLQYQCGDSRPLAIWHMDGANKISEAHLFPEAETGLTAVGVGDFNADGKPDILLQNTGEDRPVQIWYMDDNKRIGSAEVMPIATNNPCMGCTVAGVADFNADGEPDILFRQKAGESILFHVWFMDGNKQSGAVEIETKTPLASASDWMVGEIADFNGDGKPDILLESKEGLLYFWYLDGTIQTVTSLNAVSPGWKIMGR